MEFYRRAAQGRMAEVAGPTALPSDRLMRSVGLQRAADAAWDALPAASQERVLPYVRGVNAAMERGPRPLEARILDYQPEPWQARDSALWAKLLAFMLSPAWEVQIQRARLIEEAGIEALIALDPGYPADGPAMIPPGVPFGRLSRELGDAYAALAGATGLGATGAGSNAWAVAAGATAAGTPLFACDPHLTAVNPPYGHFAHIECPEYSLAGATAPGFPGVIWGCNRRIAWGATAGLVSTQDVVVEEFDDAGRYRTPDGWERAGEIEERIVVRGHPDEVLRIRTTRNGPIVSPQIPGVRHALALRSAVLDAPTSVQALLDLPRAGDIDSFRAAVASFQEFNLVVGYADVEGHIGLQMTGAVTGATAGLGLVAGLRLGSGRRARPPRPGGGSAPAVRPAGRPRLGRQSRPPADRRAALRRRVPRRLSRGADRGGADGLRPAHPRDDAPAAGGPPFARVPRRRAPHRRAGGSR